MQQLNGDITEVKWGIICHQVNCQGVMGAGLALKVRMKFPKVYDDYMKAYTHNLLFLGNVIFTAVNSNIIVANLCGQFNYGRGKQYTDYNALKKCFVQVRSLSEQTNMPVFIPGRMGCALAGGDWNVVSKLVELLIPDATVIHFPAIDTYA